MTRLYLARRLTLALLVCNAALAPLVLDAVENDDTSVQERAEQAQKLVGQLGSRSFLKRKQAMNDLVRIGLPALTALEAGALSPSREISYRCERLLLVVRDLDLQRKLAAFLRDANPAKYDLPGWDLYGPEIGEGPESKVVFVEMQKADSELMQALTASGQELTGVLMRRLVAVARPTQTPGDPLTVGRTSAILFAAGDPRVPITQVMAAYVHRMVSNPGVRAAMTSDVGTADVMRKMLSRWLRRQRDTDPYVNLLVAAQFDLKESLGFALKVLEGAKKTGIARRVALLSVSRFGDNKHLDVVEPFFTDKSVVKLANSADGQRVSIQLRDIALATAISLAKKDHRKFGFPHIRFDSYGNFHLDSLQFASDEDRLSAHTQWMKFREASNSKKPG